MPLLKLTAGLTLMGGWKTLSFSFEFEFPVCLGEGNELRYFVFVERDFLLLSW